MRDNSYQIYRSLYSCLEVTDTTNTEPQTTTTTTNESNDVNSENKNEQEVEEEQQKQVEPMIATNSEDIQLPGLDLNTEDNEKKRKRTPSPVRRNPFFFQKDFFICI